MHGSGQHNLWANELVSCESAAPRRLIMPSAWCTNPCVTSFMHAPASTLYLPPHHMICSLTYEFDCSLNELGLHFWCSSQTLTSSPCWLAKSLTSQYVLVYNSILLLIIVRPPRQFINKCQTLQSVYVVCSNTCGTKVLALSLLFAVVPQWCWSHRCTQILPLPSSKLAGCHRCIWQHV